MIEFQFLKKVYGSKTAVNGISFTVDKREILGFLGPNGAGKTTTMRIITGFLPPTSGTAKIGGFDILEEPLKMKRLLLAFLILIVVIGFFYLYEIRGKRKKQRAEKAERVLYNFHGKEITGLTLSFQGERVEMSKQDGLWGISEPIQYPADSQMLEQFVTSLNRTRILEFIEGKEELSQYQLDPPLVVVTPKTEDQVTWPFLSLGNEIPLKRGYFAILEGKESVLVVSEEIVALISTSLFGVRDKKLMSLSKWDLSTLKIKSEKDEMTFQKTSDGWDLIQPITFAANEEMISQILTALETSSIEKFVDEDPADLSPFELSPPHQSIFLKRNEDEEWFQIIFGKAEEGFLYARRNDRHPVFLVNDHILNTVMKSAEDFKEKRISRRNRYHVKKFHIMMDETVCEALLNPGGEWLTHKPEEKTLDEGDIYALLASILEIKAIDFLDSHQWKQKEKELRTPLMMAQISGDQFEDNIMFFQDSLGRIFAKNSSHKFSFYQISQDAVEKVRQALLKCDHS